MSGSASPSSRPRQPNPTLPALGIDIGGVIMGGHSQAADTIFDDNYLETPALPDAFSVIRRLRDHQFGQRIYLVSKCGAKVAERSLEWLQRWQFFWLTGVPSSQVHFCRQRSDKAAIAQELGLTHFIDDRYTVLKHLVGITPHLACFNPGAKEQQHLHSLKLPAATFTTVSSWLDLEQRWLPLPSSWRQFARRRPDGQLRHCGPRHYAESYGGDDPLVAVEIRSDPNGPYWGWLGSANDSPDLIYPSENQFLACFTQHPQELQNRGHGRILRLTVTERPA